MPGYGFNCNCYISSLIASFFTKDRLVCRPFDCHFKTSREGAGIVLVVYDLYAMSYLCQFVCLSENYLGRETLLKQLRRQQQLFQTSSLQFYLLVGSSCQMWENFSVVNPK